MCGERYYRQIGGLKTGVHYQDNAEGLYRCSDDRELLAFLLEQEHLLKMRMALADDTDETDRQLTGIR